MPFFLKYVDERCLPGILMRTLTCRISPLFFYRPVPSIAPLTNIGISPLHCSSTQHHPLATAYAECVAWAMLHSPQPSSLDHHPSLSATAAHTAHANTSNDSSAINETDVQAAYLSHVMHATMGGENKTEQQQRELQAAAGVSSSSKPTPLPVSMALCSHGEPAEESIGRNSSRAVGVEVVVDVARRLAAAAAKVREGSTAAPPPRAAKALSQLSQCLVMQVVGAMEKAATQHHAQAAASTLAQLNSTSPTSQPVLVFTACDQLLSCERLLSEAAPVAQTVAAGAATWLVPKLVPGQAAPNGLLPLPPAAVHLLATLVWRYSTHVAAVVVARTSSKEAVAEPLGRLAIDVCSMLRSSVSSSSSNSSSSMRNNSEVVEAGAHLRTCMLLCT